MPAIVECQHCAREFYPQELLEHTCPVKEKNAKVARLEAENAVLKKQVDVFTNTSLPNYEHRMLTAEAENERLRAALQAILQADEDGPPVMKGCEEHDARSTPGRHVCGSCGLYCSCDHIFIRETVAKALTTIEARDDKRGGEDEATG